MYVYVEGASNTERGKVYTVGFFMPSGAFYEESTYSDRDNGNGRAAAASRTHYLNGGEDDFYER